ncbi:hypothetical protein EKE94_09495 [Mesobaculum littorinae]|uniref:Uncharacterized protein n=1 Tax=Mesobaculum littorinae TaxID=2486419 RepID=A0A438AG78_9RHOB|nr:hypothetical protein EKE94_09495 [Mesobaculum littorinae]
MVDMDRPVASEEISVMLGANATAVRRTVAYLREAGQLTSTKGQGGAGFRHDRRLRAVSDGRGGLPGARTAASAQVAFEPVLTYRQAAASDRSSGQPRRDLGRGQSWAVVSPATAQGCVWRRVKDRSCRLRGMGSSAKPMELQAGPKYRRLQP